MKSKILVCFCLLLVSYGFSQNPKLVLQKPIANGVNNLVFSPNKKLFVVYEGDIGTFGGAKFKLYDFDSRVMISDPEISPENGPGAGNISLSNTGVLQLTTNHSIISQDLIHLKEIDTIFKVKWPEYINANYRLNDSLLLISTKIYPDKKDISIYDKTNQSRLYFYNSKTRTILHEKELDYEIPFLTYSKDYGVFLGSTNHGSCVFLNHDLTEAFPEMRLFKLPARYLYLTKSGNLIANSSVESDDNYLTPHYGKGTLLVKNINSDKFKKEITFKPQEYVKQSDYDMDYSPNNNIGGIQIDALNNELFINYGFNKMARVNLDDFSYTDISPSIKNSIGSIFLNQDTKELIITHDKQKIIYSYNNLSLYDFRTQQLVFDFDHVKEPFKKYKTIRSVGGKYCLITSPSDVHYYGIESLNINNIESRQITRVQATKWGDEITIPNVGDNWIVYNSKFALACLPTSTIFNNVNTELSIDYISGSLNSSSFKTTSILDIKGLEGTSIETVYAYFKTSDTYLATLKKKDNIQTVLIKSDGSILKVLTENEAIYDTPNAISFDENFFAFVTRGKKKNTMSLRVFNTNAWAEVFTTTLSEADAVSVNFSTDSKSLYYAKKLILENIPFELYKLDLTLGNIQPSLVRKDLSCYFGDFIVDKQHQMLYINSSDYLTTFNISTGEELYANKADFASGSNLAFYDKKSKNILIDCNEYLAYFNEGKDTPSIIYSFDNNENIIINPEDYYMSSSGMDIYQLGFAINGKGYPFTQLDLVYNRPDIVLKELNVASPEILSIYEKAYEKRIVNSNLKTSNLKAIQNNELPFATLALEETSFSTDKDEIELTLNFEDSKHEITSWNVWVNGVPVFGKSGKKMNNPQSTFTNLNYMLKLSAGQNFIDVSCTNSLGLESLKASKRIFCNSKRKSKLYYIGIGVSKYKDSLHNLIYAEKDIKDLDTLFSNYENVETRLFLNEQATTENILKIKELLNNTHEDDKVVISFSGHGLLDEEYNFYCATYDMNFSKPGERGLSYNKIEWLLDGIPSRQKLVFIDACNSGTIDKDEQAQNLGNDALESENTRPLTNTKGAVGTSTKTLTTENSYTLMQELFSDLSKSNGAIVISAAGGKEAALEKQEWGNGAFTYAILKALKTFEADINSDEKVTISELQNYVSDKVIELTQGKQKPTTRSQNITWDWELN